MKIAVIDLDNTLFNVNARRELCMAEAGITKLEDANSHQKSVFWECFLSPKYMDMDELNGNVASLLHDMFANGYMIVLLTGRRGSTQGEATIRQLQENGIPFHYLIMRGDNDYRKEDEYKLDVIRSLIGHGEVYLIDDNKNVRELAKAYGVKAFAPEEVDEISVMPSKEEPEGKKLSIMSNYKYYVLEGYPEIEEKRELYELD